ncbi:hypothetical protein [Apilactobacillus apinorum]|uniref:Uncharacterized protein n=1 Tax=Apilactobacillus apinorum TaxID=1218495 RepID=A0ABP9ZH52_9LACO|nr:hypothetical protein [Apilactobacillus apinorum]CAI2689921.1 hypothetical protein AAPFHON13_12240 [Apilactobacillus apinorum]
MHFNKAQFYKDVASWENDLKKRKFVSKNTVKGNFADLLSFTKILLHSIQTH